MRFRRGRSNTLQVKKLCGVHRKRYHDPPLKRSPGTGIWNRFFLQNQSCLIPHKTHFETIGNSSTKIIKIKNKLFAKILLDYLKKIKFVLNYNKKKWKIFFTVYSVNTRKLYLRFLWLRNSLINSRIVCARRSLPIQSRS